jgi:L-alanine-DL-glutamate epimerase-like enolase superfamily enzyme
MLLSFSDGVTMTPRPTALTPAAQRIRNIYLDPPRGGWNRRRFLAAITSLAAMPLLTDTPSWAQARQTAGRIKITGVRIQRLRVEKDWGSYEDYVGNRRGGRTGGGAILEIDTDQGLTGIGPAIATAALEAVTGYLTGKDPFDVNRHMALLYGGGREGGIRIAGGRPTGVEIARWDLIGKAANQPLYKLWGGAKDRIMPYSSMFRLGPASERAETALRLKSAGWKAIKLKSHYATLKEDVAQIEAVRRACGPEFIIATDGNKAGFNAAFQGTRGVPWSFKRALDTAKEFERLDVFFLEEPLPRYDFERLAELNRLTSINLAGGEEQNPGVHEFRWLLEKGCFDIIQPEIDTQGPAVLQKVAVIAESMEKMIMPHLGDGRLSTVCDMHLVASWPNAPLLECGNEGPEGAYEHSYAVFEQPIALTRDGYFDLPKGPGLGVAIRKDLYEKNG